MKKNMNTTDSVIRALFALIFFTLYFTHTVTGILGIVVLVLGGIFLLTSLIRFCPLYMLLGIHTCKSKE
jgi:hypothetical protein